MGYKGIPECTSVDCHEQDGAPSDCRQASEHPDHIHAESLEQVEAALCRDDPQVYDVDGDAVSWIRGNLDSAGSRGYGHYDYEYEYVQRDGGVHLNRINGLGYLLVPKLTPATEKEVAEATASILESFRRQHKEDA